MELEIGEWEKGSDRKATALIKARILDVAVGKRLPDTGKRFRTCCSTIVMQQQSTGISSPWRDLDSHLAAVCHIFRGVVLPVSWALLIPALMADSTPWGVSATQTGISLTAGVPLLSPAGDLYFCNSNSQLVKVDSTSRQIFVVPAACNDAPLVWSPDGNILIGSTKLSGADGHVLYSVVTGGYPLLAGDSVGNAYLAGICGPTLCVEKFNSLGKLIYRSSLQAPFSANYVTSIAPDANGNAYVTGSAPTGNSFLAKFDTSGGTAAYASGNPGETGVIVQVDPAGNPEVLIEPSDPTQSRVRKYDSALSTVLFDTPVPGFLPIEMLVGSDGAAVLLGGTNPVNFPQLRPTATCSLPSAPESFQPVYPTFARGVMLRLDETGYLVQSTFIPGHPGLGNGFTQPDGAGIAIADTVSGQIEVLTLGPAPEIQLGCLGNAASFVAGPLAPLEITSIFGQNLGPTQATSGQPGPGNTYPLQLAGVGVTFDGIAAPLLYVSAGQINAVTPQDLSGKTTSHVCASVNGVPTNCMDAPVQPAAPGIFLSGGYAAALNQDGTINSPVNPAPAGSIVSIFATGLGTITPAPPDGSLIGTPLPSQDLQVAMSSVLGVNQQENAYVFGGVDVLYAGPAPDEIAGLNQINFRVPQTEGGVLVLVSSAATAIGATVWTTGQTPASCQQLGISC